MVNKNLIIIIIIIIIILYNYVKAPSENTFGTVEYDTFNHSPLYMSYSPTFCCSLEKKYI